MICIYVGQNYGNIYYVLRHNIHISDYKIYNKWSYKMNWFLIALDIMFAMVAAVLGILGHGTFKSIKHLDAGKSFWIPIFVSGILFVFGSAVRIFHEFAIEYGWIIMSYTEEITRISWFLAITILFASIYSYSRKVKTTIRALTPKAETEAELTGLKKQTQDLLKQVEKLKAQQK
jgi:hypothetical protein